MKKICPFILFFGLICKAHAQALYRPKIIELGVQTSTDYSNNYSSDALVEEENRLLSAKLSLPVIMKENKLMALQFVHKEQRFVFDHSPEGQNSVQYLDASNFYNTGLRLFYQTSLQENKSLRFISGVEFSNDRFRFTRNSAKYFFSTCYAWERSEDEKISVGLVAASNLRRFNVIPLVTYQKYLTPKWTLDLLLPKSAALRYEINEKTFATTKTSFSGWRYNISDPSSFEVDADDLTLRRTDLQTGVTLEREIHDWLWFSTEVGYNHNINQFLVEPGGSRREAITEFNPTNSAYFKASIFIVPPRKFFK